MNCERCDKDVDYRVSREISKRIKRGDGVYHDECFKEEQKSRQEFIERNSWKETQINNS